MKKRAAIPATVWNADAAYFHAAKRNLQQAQDCEPEIEARRRHLKELKAEEEKILRKYGGDEVHAMDEAGPIWAEMADREYKLKQAYGPFLTHIAAVHMFCIASLEAHVKAEAHGALSGKVRDEFDALTLQGK